MMWWRASMMAMPRRMVPSTQPSIIRGVGPYHRAQMSQRRPTAPSMMRYWGEMGLPHHRHLPRSSSQEAIGMLSYQAMSLWHFGHDDGGRIRERAFGSSFGSLTMQTFRKLPNTSPNSVATIRKNASTPTQYLVEENARRHSDVERLRAPRHGDGDALGRHRIQGRPDPRALVAHDDAYGAGAALDPPDGHAVRRGGPQGHAGDPGPGDERRIIEGHHGVPEVRPHRRAKGLGPEDVSRSPKRDGALGTEAVGGAQQRADVAGVLYAVDHLYRARGDELEVLDGPAAGFDHRDDPLRRVGVGERREHPCRDGFNRHCMLFEVFAKRGAPRRTLEIGGDHRPVDGDAGRQRLLQQAHALHQCKSAAPPRLAPL